jgi:sRNA-binding carbon storage regulator CsrA
MLVSTCKEGETIAIGNDITVTIVSVQGGPRET